LLAGFPLLLLIKGGKINKEKELQALARGTCGWGNPACRRCSHGLMCKSTRQPSAEKTIRNCFCNPISENLESGSEQPEEEIDIKYTNWESETDHTASKSDEAFIVYEDEFIELEDYDLSYIPIESEEVTSSTSCSDYRESFNKVR
jgi:hypothetical protein